MCAQIAHNFAPPFIGYDDAHTPQLVAMELQLANRPPTDIAANQVVPQAPEATYASEPAGLASAAASPESAQHPFGTPSFDLPQTPATTRQVPLDKFGCARSPKEVAESLDEVAKSGNQWELQSKLIKLGADETVLALEAASPEAVRNIVSRMQPDVLLPKWGVNGFKAFLASPSLAHAEGTWYPAGADMGTNYWKWTCVDGLSPATVAHELVWNDSLSGAELNQMAKLFKYVPRVYVKVIESLVFGRGDPKQMREFLVARLNSSSVDGIVRNAETSKLMAHHDTWEGVYGVPCFAAPFQRPMPGSFSREVSAIDNVAQALVERSLTGDKATGHVWKAALDSDWMETTKALAKLSANEVTHLVNKGGETGGALLSRHLDVADLLKDPAWTSEKMARLIARPELMELVVSVGNPEVALGPLRNMVRDSSQATSWASLIQRIDTRAPGLATSLAHEALPGLIGEGKANFISSMLLSNTAAGNALAKKLRGADVAELFANLNPASIAGLLDGTAPDTLRKLGENFDLSKVMAASAWPAEERAKELLLHPKFMQFLASTPSDLLLSSNAERVMALGAGMPDETRGKVAGRLILAINGRRSLDRATLGLDAAILQNLQGDSGKAAMRELVRDRQTLSEFQAMGTWLKALPLGDSSTRAVLKANFLDAAYDIRRLSRPDYRELQSTFK